MKGKVFTSALLSLFFLFCVFNAQSQTKFDAGNVKADSNFDCKRSTDIIWYDPIVKIGKICDSKNQMEIRLKSVYFPNGESDMLVLTYNNDQWAAKKYSSRRGNIGNNFIYTSISLDTDAKKLTDYIFTSIFDTLKANNVFLLPSQGELKLEGQVFDGTRYSLTFKVDDKFRTYGFGNIESFLSMNPDRVELKQYAAIVRKLRGIFD